jgi:hypothetical protein
MDEKDMNMEEGFFFNNNTYIKMYKGETATYLPLNELSRGQEFGYDILTFLILFNSFIPIRQVDHFRCYFPPFLNCPFL